MKLNPSVLKIINTPRTRVKLMVALDCVERTILRYLSENSDNLTKAAALAVIRKETGLSDTDLLTEDDKVVAYKETA